MPIGIYPRKRKPIEERFWALVDKRGPDECWPWKGAIHDDKYPYGIFCVEAGLVARSNRFAYELVNGLLPDGLFALHKCDNPSCCNPAHLFAGTHQINMDDMVAKGRYNHDRNFPRGSSHGMAKLNEKIVSDIKEALRLTGCKSGMDLSLSIKHGVSKASISYIRLGKTWRHVS